MLSIENFSKKQLVFLFPNDGEKISFKNDNLLISTRDGKTKFQTTCYKVFALFVVGSFTMTSGLMQRAHKFSFPIFLLNTNLKMYDRIGFKAGGNTLLRSFQYTNEANSKLEIAKVIISNKIENQAAALKRQRYRGAEINETIHNLSKYAKQALAADDKNMLMGIEGMAAKQYFPCQFNNCDWQGRKPRVKCDFVNTTLDIGYTILFNFIESLVGLYGFDEYVGILHTEFYMRKSLICDLVEPFRPIVDSAVRKSISLGQCKEEDFYCDNGLWCLKKDCNKSYVLFLIKPIIENKEELFKYIQAFYRAFMKQLPANQFPTFSLGAK